MKGRSSTPDVDTLVEGVREVAVVLAKGATYPDFEVETLMKIVSDLAARARDHDALLRKYGERMDERDEWCRRAEAAEAERDRLEADRDAWRNSCLDAQDRLAERREELTEMTLQRGTWQERAVRDARRVTELEAALAGLLPHARRDDPWDNPDVYRKWVAIARDALAGDGGGA